MMSEKKKVCAESAFDAAQPVPEEASQKSAHTTQVDGQKPGRGRNQTALPGILGKQLRAAYGELLSSPVPDRFNDLIKQLERQESAASRSGGEEEDN